MAKFYSRKRYEGFSTVFRQWKAETTHCSKLHGYDVYFDVTFEGELDDRNWVADFGIMKRANGKIDGMNPKAWMDYIFDHTMLVAEDDPFLDEFKGLDKLEVIQLRILPAVGAEKFAEYIYNKLNPFIVGESEGRVQVTKIEFFENERNSAIYKP